ncbi:uncharacterized protein B0T23DRAFT_84128 [Neurospora hispaniola]|uniref:Uncharacterized protein n=1 Tax=Neurospora hispaniola TaxID=588809 RepID=A0AAJ0ICW6_9PEZI|nr:hypothetical protein B0T23DRAFT_84128 [Neurospora hispaniola]
MIEGALRCLFSFGVAVGRGLFVNLKRMGTVPWMSREPFSFLTTHSRVPVHTGKGDLVDWNKRKPPRQNHYMASSHLHDIPHQLHHQSHFLPLSRSTLTQPPPSSPSSSSPSPSSPLHPHLPLLPFPPSHPTHPVPGPFSVRFSYLPLAGNTSPAPSTPSAYHSHPRCASTNSPLIHIAPNYLYVLANNLEVFKCINTRYPADALPRFLEGARYDKMKARVMGAYRGREVHGVERRVEEAVEESVRFVKERYVSENTSGSKHGAKWAELADWSSYLTRGMDVITDQAGVWREDEEEEGRA